MPNMAVHTAVRDQSQNVKGSAAGVLQDQEDIPVLKEPSRLDGMVDARDILLDDSSGSEVQMTYFTVTHLPVR